ncbi:MAG: alpha/beta hydrolase, partial [Planctomycetaceae bacterium]|nr:alpha/beta hydrolase [Planctomycetaceae bacterium]
SRSSQLFASTPWLPVRRGKRRFDAEEIEFSTKDGALLQGSYFACRSQTPQGAIIYCHELNGTRWGISSQVDFFNESGFDVFSFDMRNHGDSRITHEHIPTPWVTKNDLADVHAAVDYVSERNQAVENFKIGLFGLSKGATVAVCVAGIDSRVTSVVLDSPAPEGRLFERNCWTTLTKVRRRWSTIFSRKYAFLLVKAILFSVACPFYILITGWWRWILGFWCGCRFVSTRLLVQLAHQPTFIIHGNNDAFCRIDQIHSFCHRMHRRPRVWVVSDSAHGETAERAGQEYEKKVVDFFQKTMAQPATSYRVDPAEIKEKVPTFLRDLVSTS